MDKNIYIIVKDLAAKFGNDHNCDANAHRSYDDINILARFEAWYVGMYVWDVK